MLGLTLLLPWPGTGGEALALNWPGRSTPPAGESVGISSAQRLQEVAPPGAVQQLQEGLADRAPRVRIVAPAADAVLEGTPWTLRLQVEDWPLVDGGALGLGPHLLVRIDAEEPLRLTSLEATLPALSPGSHRITVVAARPWGEAVKSPGAMDQIRVHRTAPNGATLPAVGSPQLLPVSPPAVVAAEPLLLDWLLIDAPLQHLRDDEAHWRLRVTVNGDSFLVDRQTPLWLRGWRPGTNAVLLELLDGRGEPLNAPFNSLVQEVRMDPGQPRPAWLGSRLAPSDLAVLLGEAPPAAPSEPPPGPSLPPLTTLQENTSAHEASQAEDDRTIDSKEDRSDADPPLKTLPPEDAPPGDLKQPRAIQDKEMEKDQASHDVQAAGSPAEGAPPETTAPEQSSPGDSRVEATDDNATEASTPPEPRTAEREESRASVTPPSPAMRPAREEVNPDGTLRREPKPGPLAGLRERVAR